MISTTYWLAAGGAVIGGLTGNRLAWPLLASAGFCLAAKINQWQFDLKLWLTVDILVIIGVVVVLLNDARKPDWCLTWQHVAIGLLFVPMFVAYSLEPAPAHILSSLAGAAQLLLVFPVRKSRAWAECVPARWRKTLGDRDEWTDLDREAYA